MLQQLGKMRHATLGNIITFFIKFVGNDMNETIPRPINVISNKTFHFLKVSFTHFLEISQNLRAWGICRIWLKLLDDVCVFVFQFLNI